MTGTKLFKLTGILLIIVTIGFNAFFTLLAMNFEYPDILRFPTGYVLEQYHAGGSGLTLQWYGMVIVSVLIIPIALLLHQILADKPVPYLTMATVFGVLAGVMSFLGFVRWVFMVPHLADVYVDPASSQATRDAAVVVFEAFHLYAGFSLGEHLGYLFNGLWTLLLGLAMLKSLHFKPWLGWLGIIAAPLIMFGSAEGAGLEIAGLVNVIGFGVWSLWLIASGIILLLAKPALAQQSAPSPKDLAVHAG